MKSGANSQTVLPEDRQHKTRRQRFILGSQYFFFAAAAILLGYVAFALLDARIFQRNQERQFQQARNSEAAAVGSEDLASASLPPLEAAPASSTWPANIDRGRSALGRIEIPRIGVAAMIMEGTDARTLRRAVGHIPGTSLPGEPGNVAIAGHRDTFFRALRDIRNQDEITLETTNGTYRYQADLIKVVEPEDTQVLRNSDEASLTLVTCYPFSYVGPAPKRFVVRAHRVQ